MLRFPLKRLYTETAPFRISVLLSQSISQFHRFENLVICSNETEESTVYARALRSCVDTSNLIEAKSIHAKLVKTLQLHPRSIFTYNNLMNAYVKCGDFEYGLQLFDEIPEKNVVSWTALISGFVQKGFPVEAFSLFCRMRVSGIRPNEFTLVSALHACSYPESSSLICAFQVYSLIVRLGFQSNVYLVNVFLTALIRHGVLDEAVEVFEGCSEKDTVSWNAILDGFLRFRCDRVPVFWHRMLTDGIVPDDFTFATVLTGLTEISNLEMGLQVHACLVKSGNGGERCVGNALVDMYLKNLRLSDGFMAFGEIPVKDVCSWTQMATGYLNCGEPIETLRMIGEMRRAGVVPNKFTLATGLNACANLASLEEGEKVQVMRIKLGEDADVCVDNALLDLFAKCGCMDRASKVFRSMIERSVVSWTTMIMGYAQNGDSTKALEIFETMRVEGAMPNHITFICVLYACSQVGCIKSALKYFSSMSQDYGIVPGEDHYACMVNLLGRAGRIKEAEELIQEMPYKPSVVIWQTLLGACRLHGDVDTSKRAAVNALALNEFDPSTYVLLSNTFANFENWSIVGTLRQWLENRDIKKMPGSSWLEVKR